MSPAPPPEQRVDERVREHVAVRMAGEPARAGDLDAAEDERDAVREGVRARRGRPSRQAPTSACRKLAE